MFYDYSYVLCFFLILQCLAMRFDKNDLITVIFKLLTGDVWRMFYDMKAITKIILSGLAGYFGNLRNNISSHVWYSSGWPDVPGCFIIQQKY